MISGETTSLHSNSKTKFRVDFLWIFFNDFSVEFSSRTFSNQSNKFLFDGYKPEDNISSGVKKTHVVITNHDTGEIIFEGCNKVIFPGSEFTAKSHFDISAESVVSSYSELMNLDQDAITTSKDIDGAKEKIYRRE